MYNLFQEGNPSHKIMNFFRNLRNGEGYIPLSEPKSPLTPTGPREGRREFNSDSMVKSILVAVVVLLCFGVGYLSGRSGNYHQWKDRYFSSLEAPALLSPELGSTPMPPKPSDTKVVGLVFFGRRELVNVLDCYLRKNLVANGGYLDSVRFLIHTEDEDDLAFLDKLLEDEPGYEKISTKGSQGWGEYKNMWKHAQDPDTIYVKIDDDVVYIHDEAIPRLVTTLFARPDAYGVGANSINHALLTWSHWHSGAVYPFVPEMEDGPEEELTDWRPSKLPRFSGKLDELADQDLGSYSPKKRQRFLPLGNNTNTLLKTPVSKATWDVYGPALHSWQMAGQIHYSLLQNIEQDTLDRYIFSNAWNTMYQRYSINFIAVRGSTISQRPVDSPDDEQELTVTIPRELNRPFLIDTRAIISHFAYHPQWNLRDTDVLERYRLLANEKVCLENNQKDSLQVQRAQ